jgi:hypothetical protein
VGLGFFNKLAFIFAIGVTEFWPVILKEGMKK